MTKKPLNCVEMKRRGAAAVREKLIGKTVGEELAFWNAQETELRRRQRDLRRNAGGRDRRSPVKNAR
jgi:hypothetical protein